MIILETNKLTKQYKSQRGCKNISLSVKSGQIFGLLGPNGAGKSTFVKMIVGLLKPTSGEASIMGLPLGHLEARKQIGYLPELFRYQDWLTAKEVLYFHAHLGGMPYSDIHSGKLQKRMDELLYEVGLEGRKERVRHFSKGMQQRLGLACALLMDPTFIILDEPSSALDPIGRHEVRTLLKKLRQQGKTVFLNTHLLEDVETLCDEVTFLYEGEQRSTGNVDEIIHAGGKWEFVIGGWLPEWMEELLQLQQGGIKLQIIPAADEGIATIKTTLAHREQAGWINAQLVEYGFTLYEARPVQTSMEEWFLSLVDDTGEVSL